MIVELLNESVEKDEFVSDEESSKDGDFNLPNYFRYYGIALNLNIALLKSSNISLAPSILLI